MSGGGDGTGIGVFLDSIIDDVTLGAAEGNQIQRSHNPTL